MDELIEELVVRNILKANTYFLTKIGQMILKIRGLKPSQAKQLIQILKYGGNYEDILGELSRLTKMPKKDIEQIFSSYAKKDLNFAKQFYEYRNIPMKPYSENTALKRQVEALSNITHQSMNNFTRSRALGYTIKGLKGVKFLGLRETYEKVLDEALLNVGQGKETFDASMSRILKQLGESGLKTLDYESGRHIRLDSMVRMHLQSGLRELHNENQRLFGEEFGADGVEISVHINPAPDHEDAQGRQFSINKYDKNGELIEEGEFEKLQDIGIAKDYTGKEINMIISDGAVTHRPISEYNCYHYTFAIVLGVSKPRYSDEELKKIKEDNEKGFEYNGKHYTMYEGTQLQRQLELAIRKQKDIQILARESDNTGLILESQNNITKLSKKYKELLEASQLPSKKDRMRVGGYRRVDVRKPKIEPREAVFDYDLYEKKLASKNVLLKDDLKNLDKALLERNIKHLDYLTDKYNVSSNLSLEVHTKANRSSLGTTWYGNNNIGLNAEYFKDKNKLIEAEARGQRTKWHVPVKEDNLDIYTITHEYGHAIENDYTRRYLKDHKGINTDIKREYWTYKEQDLRRDIDKEIRDELFKEVKKKEKLNITEIKNKYFSDYGKSKRSFEWFAETFTQLELGEQNALTEAMKEWIERNKV